ncbi:4-hydroxyphenylacetate 3-hydroxylase C-terminal domain-containing protein [Paenibacillus rhizoplanae]
MILSESDFDTSAGAYLNQYLKGTASEAWFRNALFRLAWELGAGAFGGRQIQFERLFLAAPKLWPGACTTAMITMNPSVKSFTSSLPQKKLD